MPHLTRRDFLDGIAIAVGALACGKGGGDAGASDFAPERAPGYYPPALTGLRGSHPGSFEYAHALRDGNVWQQLGEPADVGETYDLVVVGAGISGLSAAHYFRRARPGAKVLVLDNHDDVGGHAKRNELGTLVTYGGTESVEYPSLYSKIARDLLVEIGVDVEHFAKVFVRATRKDLGLAAATFFDQETFGADRLVLGELDPPDAATLAQTPLSPEAQRDLLRLYRDPVDYWAPLDVAGKHAALAKLSYRDFLRDLAKVSPEVIALLQKQTHSLFGVGIDAVSCFDCWALELPGFEGARLDRELAARPPRLGKTPYLEMRHGSPSLFFPDGNATVARLLVRRLVPAALPGSTMADAATARLDYATLDDPGSPTRIRLNSTVVRARNAGDAVELTYVRGGRAHLVRGASCVLACWNTVIPYLVPDLHEPQRRALAYGVKVPIVYANAALRNWHPFAKLGIGSISIPGGYFTSARLELPTGLHTARPSTPDEPAIVKLVRTPCKDGLPARDQHRLGRAELFTTPFATFEHEIRSLLTRILAAGGFDPARDLTAITVNRWPHGYAYEYNSLWDPPFAEGEEPCVLGRRKFGRIAIANADAGAYAYTDCAIEQAYRAVGEITE
ncbi:MAG: FAD-dependent oxidoreductase [Deltaproteobacteria bacterium]|nr:FAD-dependent oxidoreductase [Deltaproteobacteria bacterium]